jgi:hypothetical protein
VSIECDREAPQRESHKPESGLSATKKVLQTKYPKRRKLKHVKELRKYLKIWFYTLRKLAIKINETERNYTGPRRIVLYR